MLCQFSFSNFRSYRNETTLDFQAGNLTEFNDSLVGNNLLPVNVIYGPNGGGKSNAVKAVMCLISTVLKPVYETHTNRQPLVVPLPIIPCVPFCFEDEAENEPTEFLIHFRIEKYEYRYFLSILHGEVISESLDRRKLGASRAAKIFNRENGEITLGAIIAKNTNTSVNAKMPFLSFLFLTYSIPVIQEVQDWFESCIMRSYADPLAEAMVMIASKEDEHKQFIRILNDCGIDISDFRYDEDKKDIIISRELNGRTYELPYEEESDGTQKLFISLPLVMLALQRGSLLIIDELDAKLHPKLLRYVIAMFTNPNVNKNGAQLLFTSHDMSTLKSSVFRRDEIWFAAAGNDKKSELYSLYEIRDESNDRIRTTAAYDKQYLEGRYGADPYLQNMISGGDWT